MAKVDGDPSKRYGRAAGTTVLALSLAVAGCSSDINAGKGTPTLSYFIDNQAKGYQGKDVTLHDVPARLIFLDKGSSIIQVYAVSGLPPVPKNVELGGIRSPDSGSSLPIAFNPATTGQEKLRNKLRADLNSGHPFPVTFFGTVETVTKSTGSKLGIGSREILGVQNLVVDRPHLRQGSRLPDNSVMGPLNAQLPTIQSDLRRR